MSGFALIPLTGSDRRALPDARLARPADPAERVEVTLVTRRAAPLPRTGTGSPARLSLPELRQSYGSAPADQDRVAEVLTAADPAIEVTSTDPGSRRMTVAGPAERAHGRIRHRAQHRGQSEPHRRRGHAPLPQRRTADPRRAGRHRGGRPGPGQPAAGRAALPVRRRCAGQAGLLYAAAGRQRVSVPGGYRRQRADDRDHRTGRRLRPVRSGQLLLRARHRHARPSPRWASTAPATSPARTRRAPTARYCSTSRSPARSHPAPPRSSTSRPTPTRASWTRSRTQRTRSPRPRPSASAGADRRVPGPPSP